MIAYWTSHHYRLERRRWTTGSGEEMTRRYREEKAICEMYPDTGNIAVAIKTGATEAHRKLPAILSTCLQCVKDVMIFSDLKDQIGELEVHDIFSRFSPSMIENNRDFDIYRKQQELVSEHRAVEIESLANMPAHPRDWRTKGKNAAWSLAAYVNIPMLEMAYELQPNRDWYVFLDADTYLSWPNFKRWLPTLDPRSKLYIGNSLRKSETREPKYFAHGGSGYVLSGAAAREFAVDRRGVTKRLEERMHTWWAGDIMIADILYDVLQLEVTSAAPMFNELESRAIPFAEDSWCQPAITLHHMAANDFIEIFQKEKALNFSRLLLRDVYNTVYPFGLPSKRDNWDNISDADRFALDVVLVANISSSAPLTNDPNSSFESCERACQQNEQCSQFFFRNPTIKRPDTHTENMHQCLLSRAFRLGHSKHQQRFDNEDEPNTARSWTSGWRNDKIAQWVEEHQTCPEEEDIVWR